MSHAHDFLFRLQGVLNKCPCGPGSPSRTSHTNVFDLASLCSTERTIYVELIGHLGKGEASCIALAKQRGTIVVTDDRGARKQCQQMNLRATGTIGILKASLIVEDISLVARTERLDVQLGRCYR